MPNINTLKESKFLRKEDCGDTGLLLTIQEVNQQNVAKEGADPELKWCVHFAEVEKPLVMNPTNAQLIANIAKSDETEHWSGVKVVLYNEPSISYQGKVTGGIRVRAPRGKAAQPQTAKAPIKQPQARPAPAPTEDLASEGGDPEVPF